MTNRQLFLPNNRLLHNNSRGVPYLEKSNEKDLKKRREGEWAGETISPNTKT